MNIYENHDIAKLIENNPYVGRGIVLGKTPDGNAVSAYFIMGRSANSRNRVFTLKDDGLYTEPFDYTKVEDPSLIIYRALCMHENSLVVTNGDQTDTIYDGLKAGKSFSCALKSREFEPDAPNFTPRISGIINFAGDKFDYEMSILKSSNETGDGCNRYTYSYEPLCGVGHFIHTYITDGNPIPTFCGEPERVITDNDIDVFTNKLWAALNEDNKISLYVRYSDASGKMLGERLINKNK